MAGNVGTLSVSIDAIEDMIKKNDIQNAIEFMEKYFIGEVERVIMDLKIANKEE